MNIINISISAYIKHMHMSFQVNWCLDNQFTPSSSLVNMFGAPLSTKALRAKFWGVMENLRVFVINAEIQEME